MPMEAGLSGSQYALVRITRKTYRDSDTLKLPPKSRVGVGVAIGEVLTAKLFTLSSLDVGASRHRLICRILRSSVVVRHT